LKIVIEGYWFRTILWEVKLMAMISELYFEMTGTVLSPDWVKRIEDKAKALSEGGALWSDFGTRRRRAKAVQARVVQIMKEFKGFLGTSNVHLAMLNGVTPIGTSAHEAVMAMAARYGVGIANSEWYRMWRQYYGNKLSIALTDTFTTDFFLKSWGIGEARDWDGLRQDSGCPHVWANKVIDWYGMLRVPLTDKKLVFSDDLNVPKALGLNETYKKIAIPVFGIGTNLTNDTFNDEQKALGIKPLNMVIKLKAMDFGDGWKGVVKLSDSPGKHTGLPEDIERIKSELGI
jgi:nicotinate phosphoribosyltransferase